MNKVIYEVKPCVCDYAIYKEGKIVSDLIFDSKKYAEYVCKIMNLDYNKKFDYLDNINSEIEVAEKAIYKYIVDNKLKKGTVLYHVVDNNTRIIEVEVTEVNSNDNGIYVYARSLKENEDNTVNNYRFILITHGEIKKTHFNKEVFFDISSALKLINKSNEEVKYKEVSKEEKKKIINDKYLKKQIRRNELYLKRKSKYGK